MHIGFSKQAGAIAAAFRAGERNLTSLPKGAMRAATDFGRRSGSRSAARGLRSAADRGVRASELMSRAAGRIKGRAMSVDNAWRAEQAGRFLPIGANAGARMS